MRRTTARRSTGFEKYILDQELEFRATARRNKLAGLWAAELQGLSGPAAEAFALEVVGCGVLGPSEDTIIGKLYETLAALSIEPGQIREKITELKDMAWAQLHECEASIAK